MANITSSPIPFVSQNWNWCELPRAKPVLSAVQHQFCCWPEVAAFHKLTEILTSSEMPHAIISEKLRELTLAPSFSPTYLPPTLWPASPAPKKHWFYFIGKQQNWNKWLLAEHVFRYSWKTMGLMSLKCTVWLMPSLQGPRRTHLLHLSERSWAARNEKRRW